MFLWVTILLLEAGFCLRKFLSCLLPLFAISSAALRAHCLTHLLSSPARKGGFLEAKHTIFNQRNSLKTGTIEDLECLKSWFRTGIDTEEDLHTIVAAEVEMMDVELDDRE